MTSYKTEQEQFWAGRFGSEYIARNSGNSLLASNLALFSKALRQTRGVRTCLEVGANIGMNLQALKLLHPELELHAIEINEDAVAHLKQLIPSNNVYHTSILDFQSAESWDLVLTKGVLIHINPEILFEVYDKLVAATGRYLLVAEYYNPVPVEVSYRGHAERLFKRDYAGEILDRYPEMKLVDYGFAYRRDPNFPCDDITWFLMEKC